ncbi:MAG TPA: LamG-like jellyroll fold domain-containing protein [Burkholderiales bacterium]|nr:LamG-like jellyroll fold domain-containing protein [Burkholderiales bacterium]
MNKNNKLACIEIPTGGRQDAGRPDAVFQTAPDKASYSSLPIGGNANSYTPSRSSPPADLAGIGFLRSNESFEQGKTGMNTKLVAASASAVCNRGTSEMTAAPHSRFRLVISALVTLIGMGVVLSPESSWAQTGLVAAYSFNEGSGTKLTDVSGNGNNGTISGATWTTSGKFGSALTFNGSSAKVTIPDAASLRLANGMTLEAWVYPTKAPTGWRAVVDKNVDGYYLMASTDVGNRVGTGGTWVAGNQNTIGPSALPINTWTHLAATFDGATVRLFVNGVQVASQAQTSPLATTNGTLQIGADSYPTEYFAGRIDEVRVYNRALSAADIVTDMNTAIGSAPAPDTTPPSAPANLAATVSGNSQVNLSWSAATDNVGVTGYRVERCQGTGCANFAQIATPATTSFNDTGLSAGASYSYRVRATDAAGNIGSYSNVAPATLTVLDTTLPTAPTGLFAASVTLSFIFIQWNASSDNIGVVGYRVERCTGISCADFSELAITGNLFTYSDNGIAANTDYSYRVRAFDAAGNLSAYSNTIGVAAAVADITPPSAPASLNAIGGSTDQTLLSWLSATDNIRVDSYRVERCQMAGCSNFTQIGTSFSTTFRDFGLNTGTSYSYRVRAVDPSGNLGAYSNIATAFTLAMPDRTPPTAPTGLVATAVNTFQINTSWNASTDNVALLVYIVERCTGFNCNNFLEVGTSTSTNFTDIQAASNTRYNYRVRAMDASSNLSAYSNVATALTFPLPPTDLVAAYTFNEGAGTAVADISGHGNTGSINGATWTTSGKFGGALIFDGSSAKVTIPDSASLRLTSGMTLEAWVYPTTAPTGWRAVIDKNVDGYYLMASTDVGNRVGTGGTWIAGNQNTIGPSTLPVNTWSHIAATFDGAMVRLYLNGIQLVSQAQTTSLAPTSGTLQIGGDSYPTEYFVGRIDEVRIYNRALSSAEIMIDMNTAVGVVPDTTMPTTPTGLGATAVSSRQIDLSWNASIDDVVVAGYRLERCQNAGCSNFAQIATSTGTTFSDTSGLTTGNSYSYRVRAVDATGNLSLYSNIASTYLFQPNPSPTPSVSQAVAYQIDYAHSGFAKFGKPLQFPATPTWSVTLNGSISYPLIVDNKVFVLTWTRGPSGDAASSLYGIDKQTGNIIWGPVAMVGTFPPWGLVYDHGKIFVVSHEGLLQWFDGGNGQAGWSTQLDGPQFGFQSSPTAVNGIVYVEGFDSSSGRLYAVDESNGKIIWKTGVSGGGGSSPTASSDGVFVTYPSVAYKFNPLTGATLWSYTPGGGGGSGNTSPYANGLLYLRDWTNPNILVFDGATGTKVGNVTVNLNSPIPAFSTQSVFFVGFKTLKSVDLTTGNLQWTFVGDGGLISPPIVIDGTIIAGSTSGNVYALDAITGAQIWSGFAGAPILAPKEDYVQPTPGFGAGEGFLIVPATNVLTAWRLTNP